MPSFFKRSKAAAAADDAKSNQKSTPIKSFRTPKRNSRSGKDDNDINSVFSGDESLLQLREETAELLRLVKLPAKSVLKGPNATRQHQPKNAIGSNGANGTTPSKACMTIEVLDDDDDDDESNRLPITEAKTTGSGSNPSQAAASLAPPSMAQSTGGGAGSTMDPFAFNTEESRVRRASDTFYPDTSPSKKAMGKQFRDFTNEQLRLKSIERNEQLRNERRHHDIEHHQLNKLQSYYRRFICNFAQLALPLGPLVKKIHVWTWRDEQQAAFEAIKKALQTGPVLKLPDFQKDFIVTTDASGYCVGGVLSQLYGKDDHPVAFYSKKLGEHEVN